MALPDNQRFESIVDLLVKAWLCGGKALEVSKEFEGI
jgi:hypothetical protein